MNFSTRFPEFASKVWIIVSDVCDNRSTRVFEKCVWILVDCIDAIYDLFTLIKYAGL